MLRILPVVIVLLALYSFSKFMDLMEEDTGVIKILDLHALDDDQPKNNDDNNIKINDINDLGGSETGKEEDNLEVNNKNNYINPPYLKYKYHVSCEDLEKNHFSQEEINILQNLKRKNEELDAKEEKVLIKESALTGINDMIEEKLQKLAIAQEKFSKIAQPYEATEREKVERLVKIYESMKPKDAAKIFDELQPTVLLPVVEKIKEQKLAAIIAEMTPVKAKDLTTTIANSSRILTLLNASQ